MVVDAVLFGAANALFLLAGVGVVSAAGWWREYPRTVASLSLAYLAGVATYGVVAQTLYVLGAPLTQIQVVTVCVLLGVGGLAVDARRSGGVTAERMRLPAPFVAAVAITLAVLAVDLWFQPLWAYDAWTFWTPKARALAELDGLDSVWFTSADVIWKDYPLLLPAVEAAGFRFTGYRTEFLDLQSWLLYLALVIALLDVVVRRFGGVFAWAAVLTLVAAPTIAFQLAAAVADIPLACQFALGGVLLLLWRHDRRPAALVVAAVLLAGAAATKVEGLPLALAAAAALAVAELLERRSPVRPLGILLAAVAVAVVPWQIWLAVMDVEVQGSISRLTDLRLLAEQAHFVPEIVLFLGERALDPTQWLLALPLAAAAAVTAARIGRGADVGFYVVTLALGALALVLAYWTTPFDVDEHLATSGRRTITPLIVFALAAAPLLAARERALRLDSSAWPPQER